MESYREPGSKPSDHPQNIKKNQVKMDLEILRVNRNPYIQENINSYLSSIQISEGQSNFLLHWQGK